MKYQDETQYKIIGDTYINTWNKIERKYMRGNITLEQYSHGFKVIRATFISDMDTLKTKHKKPKIVIVKRKKPTNVKYKIRK